MSLTNDLVVFMEGIVGLLILVSTNRALIKRALIIGTSIIGALIIGALIRRALNLARKRLYLLLVNSR